MKTYSFFSSLQAIFFLLLLLGVSKVLAYTHGMRSDSPGNRYYLGMTVVKLTPEILETVFGKMKNIEDYMKDSLYIQNVFPASPASRSGLQPGDVIFKVEGVRCTSLKEFFDRVDNKGTVIADVYNDGKLRRVKITPEKLTL